MMDYAQTISYLYEQLPVFTRVGASAYKEDLTNTIELCKRLNDPQNKFKSIHVGGTNGKGSTSHMLAAILQVAGYKTGLYTSPHLRDFRERIRINGEMISEQQVIDFVAEHKADFEDIQPSFFEMTVGLAFDIFAKENLDVAIIEVGLGGRLDSTNIINPLLSIITNIGWDHMNILGNSLQLIAAEKAGIIKQNVPVIIGEYQPEVADIFLRKANKEEAELTFASDVWSVVSGELSADNLLNVQVSNPAIMTNNTQHAIHTSQQTTHNSQLTPHTSHLTPHTSHPTTHFQLDLTGTYQLKNIKTVLSAVEELRIQGFIITEEHVKTALRQVKTLTGLHGRWETLGTNPLTICDTGHNFDGMQEVLRNIAATTYEHLHFVIGMVNDKDITKVLSMLPADATYYFCKPDIPRGLQPELLQHQAAQFNLKGNVYHDVKAAFRSAQKNAQKNDLVFIGGSTFVVAEII